MEARIFTRDTSWQQYIKPALVVFSGALFFFYEFIQMNLFNAISPDLMREFSLNAQQLGWLSTTFLIADTLFLLPAGLLLDRFSTRNVILLSMLVSVISTLGFGLTHSLWLAATFHFITGVGNAFCFLSCVMLATRWFPPKHQALVIGLVITIAFLGGMMSQTPMADLTQIYGWREAVMFSAILGAGILFIIWLFVEDFPAEEKQQREAERQTAGKQHFWETLRLAASNPQNWYCGLYTSFLNLPIMVLDALWGGLYLSNVHHYSMKQATLLTSMIFVGAMFGCPVAGWFSDNFGARRTPMIAGAILSFITIMAIMLIPDPSFKILVVLFFALGFVTSTQVVSYPMIAESNPPSLTATAMAVASVIIMGAAALAQPLYGWLLDLEWSGKIVNHIAVYTPSNFQIAMAMFPIAFIIALAAVLLSKETHCQPLINDDNQEV